MTGKKIWACAFLYSILSASLTTRGVFFFFLSFPPKTTTTTSLTLLQSQIPFIPLFRRHLVFLSLFTKRKTRLPGWFRWNPPPARISLKLPLVVKRQVTAISAVAVERMPHPSWYHLYIYTYRCTNSITVYTLLYDINKSHETIFIIGRYFIIYSKGSEWKLNYFSTRPYGKNVFSATLRTIKHVVQYIMLNYKTAAAAECIQQWTY